MLRTSLTTTALAVAALAYAVSGAQASDPIHGTWTKSFHLDGGKHKKFEVTFKKSTEYTIHVTGDQKVDLHVQRFWNRDLKNEYRDSGDGKANLHFKSVHHGDRPYVIHVKNRSHHRGQFTLTIKSGHGSDPPPSHDPPPTNPTPKPSKWLIGVNLIESPPGEDNGLYIDKVTGTPALGKLQPGEYIQAVYKVSLKRNGIIVVPPQGELSVSKLYSLNILMDQHAEKDGRMTFKIYSPRTRKTRFETLNLRPRGNAVPSQVGNP